MNIKEALSLGRKHLKESPSAALDSEVLLSNVLKRDRLYLYTYPEYTLTDLEKETYQNYLKRRELKEPVAYITGKKEFMGIDLTVSPSVLIPRPETETLVETALKYIPEERPFKVLDLCCGSGAIGIALKIFRPQIQLTLADISEEALEITRENLKQNSMTATVLKSDLFENITDSFDMIISNPPYISEEELLTLDKGITKFEPVLALRAEMNGYYFYDRIAKEADAFLKEEGLIFCEIGAGQGRLVKQFFENQGYRQVTILKDFADCDRIVKVYT